MGEKPKQGERDFTSPFALSRKAVLKDLKVSQKTGLDGAEAVRRLGLHGPNRLGEAKPLGLLQILFDQFKSIIVVLLVFAGAVSFVFGREAEGIAIFVVLILNAAIGFFTELRGIRSMEALRRLSSVTAKVRRRGKIKIIPAEELVPGDIVVLEAGDVVPADLRLITLSRLQANEAILTGESLPVSKTLDSLDEGASLPEQTNMAFQGTGITLGGAEGVVVATGQKTQLGQIAVMTEEAEEERTPLEKRITALSRQLVWMTLVLAFAVAATGLLGGKPLLLMIQTGIALAVAAVPEGLPMVATLALARGMWRMAKKNALIERLSAVETLGSTTVIMVDKTGTLTENRMSAVWLSLPSGDFRVVPKEEGRTADFVRDGQKVDPKKEPSVQEFFRAGVLCNTAFLETERVKEGYYRGVGDPTEVALLVLGARAGFAHHDLDEKHPEIRVDPFDPEKKMMASIHHFGPKTLTTVKGAPEEVLEASTKVPGGRGGIQKFGVREKAHWLKKNREMAARGLRVLAVAERVGQGTEDVFQGLTFLGLIGLEDPPRRDVPPAIGACRKAGVRVIMVTGDNAETAAEISRAIGLTDSAKPLVLEGRDLTKLNFFSKKDAEKILDTVVFARVSPKQKLELIDFYQKRGEIVAMTGDGVNDAPALKEADIGVAMGRRGSQVAREASDMILRDDAFSTIVSAIQQGRVIFGNIRKFIVYLLSCNISEIFIVGLAFLVGLPLPLLPLQILYLNLVTDVFPAFALGAGEGEPGQMQKPPRDPGEPILPKSAWGYIGLMGGVMTISVLGVFVAALQILHLPAERAVTVSFMTLALTQLWHVFNMREIGSRLFKNEITKNPLVWGAVLLSLALLALALFVPPLADILGLYPMEAEAWLFVLGFSLIPLVFGQAVKKLKILF